jgi:hypothetical protein
MDRRAFVGALAATPLLAWVGDLMAKTFQYPGFPPPNAGQSPGDASQGPPGVAPMPPPPKIDPRMVLKYHQQQLKQAVNNLYDLARKLRNQVNKTDSTEVLSLDMLHTTEKIEKLAKHIRELATQ